MMVIHQRENFFDFPAAFQANRRVELARRHVVSDAHPGASRGAVILLVMTRLKIAHNSTNTRATPPRDTRRGKYPGNQHGAAYAQVHIADHMQAIDLVRVCQGVAKSAALDVLLQRVDH